MEDRVQTSDNPTQSVSCRFTNFNRHEDLSTCMLVQTHVCSMEFHMFTVNLILIQHKVVTMTADRML